MGASGFWGGVASGIQTAADITQRQQQIDMQQARENRDATDWAKKKADEAELEGIAGQQAQEQQGAKDSVAATNQALIDSGLNPATASKEQIAQTQSDWGITPRRSNPAIEYDYSLRRAAHYDKIGSPEKAEAIRARANQQAAGGVMQAILSKDAGLLNEFSDLYPNGVKYSDVKFSPDGKTVTYRTSANSAPQTTTTTRLLTGVMSQIDPKAALSGMLTEDKMDAALERMRQEGDLRMENLMLKLGFAGGGKGAGAGGGTGSGSGGGGKVAVPGTDNMIQFPTFKKEIMGAAENDPDAAAKASNGYEVYQRMVAANAPADPNAPLPANYHFTLANQARRFVNGNAQMSVDIDPKTLQWRRSIDDGNGNKIWIDNTPIDPIGTKGTLLSQRDPSEQAKYIAQSEATVIDGIKKGNPTLFDQASALGQQLSPQELQQARATGIVATASGQQAKIDPRVANLAAMILNRNAAGAQQPNAQRGTQAQQPAPVRPPSSEFSRGAADWGFGTPSGNRFSRGASDWGMNGRRG